MKKKWAILGITVLMVFLMAACGSNTNESSDEVMGQNSDDGIEQTVYKPDDKTVCVRLINNTGGDISISAFLNYTDEEYGGVDSFEQRYLPEGESFILAHESEFTITDYDVSYEIGEPSLSVKDYYEKSPYTVTENELGALDYTLEDHTEYGYNDTVMIFYETSDGEILGYEELYCLGNGDRTYTFESPGYEYDKYEIIRAAV